MDSSQTKVPLPSSATETEQTIFEKQTLLKTPQVSDTKETEADSQSVHSESDNEGVSSVIESVDVIDKVINKTSDEFEKITSSSDADSKKLLETDIDKIDDEVIEILREKSVERDEKLKRLSDDATNINKISDETVECETVKNIEEEKVIEKIQVEEKCQQESEDSKNDEEEKPKETIIDEDLLPEGAVENFIAQSSEHNKPPIPIQTYLWEDVKRSKEQGGYPWTHLYKRPLGEDEEPEVILTYDRSPKSGRRSQPETPKSQKKVQIQEEVEIAQEENLEIPNETESKEPETEEVDASTDSQTTDVKKSPKSILKRSQKLLDNIKPNTSKFDSDSLKRKIKTPLQKIKKMADQQISKVKTRSSIKKIPVSKDEIVLNEKLEILKLKESPKSQHREFAAFIVKQDSDDTIDIVDLEQSPSESRKNRLIESGLITPDEIIDLPVSTDNKPQESDSCKNLDENQKENEPYIHKHSQKEMSPTTVIIHKRKEHIYEEIDDFVSKIAFDSEHVERVHCDDEKKDLKLIRQDNVTDPIFDEFSRELNKKIRKSLSSQDDSIRHELMRKIPKIEELEKQISDEDREELKVEQSQEIGNKNTHLLAPISSIDSTSSDEERRAQLSIVAEESETSDSLIKKKSFDEPSVDIHDVESLKIDDSDVSTLIDDNKIESMDEESGLNESNEKDVQESHQIELNQIESVDEVINDSNQDETKEESPLKEENVMELKENRESLPKEEQDVKEDVELKENEESPKQIKVDPKWSKMSDHEYEPIGEPMVNENEPVNEQQKRKSSDPMEQGNEKKLLRSPSDESEDNISAQDFQDQLESRFFRKEIEPISDNEEQTHQENTFEEAVIIDEEPVAREIPKKKSFMESAQVSGKNFQKKIKAQASSIKTSLNNKMKKKPKEKPVAVEVATVENDNDEPEVVEDVPTEKENVESITINVQEAEEEASKTKKSKMSNFTKNLKKPTMPKFKKPHFKKPDLPKMPDLKVSEKIQNLRKLGRSKSMKESSNGDSTSINTPEVASAEPTNRKKFDFGTYPRMIRNKFKRPKLPERSDASMVSESPAPDEDFGQISQSFAQRGPVASRWPEYIEEESGKYQHFDSESDLDRERLESDREEIRHLMTEEQRQLEDMDRENLQIHLMAKQEKFRKPYVERQESDITSEDDKLMWSGMLNKNVKDEEEFEQNALRFDDNYKFTLDAYTNQELNRSSTPQTNQETQSSGSSGIRRRGGFLDDDDEYFMREQRITNKDHEAGEYIDSAIKEGLSSPDENALTQIGKYDEIEADNRHELSPEKPTRSLKRKKKTAPQEEEEAVKDVPFDYYKTYPPHRPSRREKKSVSVEPEEDIDFQQDIPDDSSDIIDENELETFKGIEHPDLAYLNDDFDNELDYNISKVPVPPTPPRRRKKKIRPMHPQGFLSLRNEHLSQKPISVEDEKIIVYREERNFVPLAQEEHFTTPTPTPRRTRSRSQISAYTLDDAESFKKDSVDGFIVNNQDNKENDYATIKKEIPSRPVRRKRSTKSLGDKQFATLPLIPRRSDHELAPPRPPRNYCTIGPEKPDKPPRRKSAGSLVEIAKTIKDDDYEEILDNNAQNKRLSQRLQSGDIVNKMKDRPLPPPPRPRREGKKPKKEPTDNEKFDSNEGGAERISEPLKIDVDVVDHAIHLTESIQRNIHDTASEPIEKDVDLTVHDNKYLPRQESDFSDIDKPIEVEVSTQTDPLPYDEFTMEDEDVDIEEFVGSDGKIKTLEDILKEEQEAEIERARQLAEAENLARGIQQFRETSQRSLSEHTRTSADRSRSLSRPITPSAVVVERKKSSPIIFERQEQVMTEAGLFIHPITYDDFGLQPIEQEQQPVPQDESTLDVNNNLEEELHEENQNFENLRIASRQDDEQDEIDEMIKQAQLAYEKDDDEEQNEIDEIIKQAQLTYGKDDEVDDDLDAEMQRKIEEMIESVMNTAREQAEWMKEPQEEKIENIDKEVEEEVFIKKENILKETEAPEIQVEIAEDAPLPPPRRKSNIDESILRREFSEENKVSSVELPNDADKVTEEPRSSFKEQNKETIISNEPSFVEPSVPHSIINEPSFEEPSVPHSITSDPSFEEPAEQHSITKEPTFEEPSVPHSITNEPSFEKVEYEVETQTSFDIPTLQAQDSKEQQADDQMELSQALSEDRPSSPFPSRLHLSSLEIDNLSVSQLQAGRITASEIDAHSIVTNEFESKQTNLPGQTVQIELPPGLIEEIVERVRTAERAEIQALIAEQQKIVEEQQKLVEEQRIALEEQRMHVEEPKPAPTVQVPIEESVIEEPRAVVEQQQVTQLESPKFVEPEVKSQEAEEVSDQIPPERPPLPEDYHASPVPQSFYQLKDASGDENKAPPSHHYRRRKHAPKKKESTSDEDYQKDQRPKSRAGPSNDQSVASLGGQFLRACGNSLIDSGSQLMEILRASSKDENSRDLHVALIILIIIVAGLFLMGTGNGKSVHHHHWDFFNPPENQGR